MRNGRSPSWRATGQSVLLRDVHYISAATSQHPIGRQTAERRMDNQLARAHDAEGQDQARHSLSRRPSLCPDPHNLSIGLSFNFKSQAPEENGRVDIDGDGVGEATITQIVHGPGGAQHRAGGVVTSFRGEISLDGEQFKGSVEGV